MNKKLLVLMITAVVLPSCKSMFTMDTIMTLAKGMPVQDVRRMVDVDSKYSFRVTHLGNEYAVEVFPIQIGVKKTERNYTTTDTRRTATTIITTTTQHTQEEKNELATDYFFLFDANNKLLYWGFLQEFSKSEDPFVGGISSDIYSRYYSLKTN